MRTILTLGLTFWGIGYGVLIIPYPFDLSIKTLMVKAITGMALVIGGSLFIGLYLFLKKP